jgi:hypothetical protein
MRIWLFVTLAIFTAIPFSLRPAGAYDTAVTAQLQQIFDAYIKERGPNSRGFPVELYEFHASSKTRIQLPPKTFAISSAV